MTVAAAAAGRTAGATSVDAHRRHRRRQLLVLAGLGSVVVLASLVAVSVGSTNIAPLDVLRAVGTRVVSGIEADPFEETVVWSLRLPRVAAGIVAGAGLAIAGAVMQGVTRNPLVSPFTIGISSAAAFGASLAISLGASLSAAASAPVVASAFLAAMACMAIVFGLSRMKGVAAESIVLAGVALAYFFGALTSVLQFFASEEELSAMIHWTFGTFNAIRWGDVFPMFVVVALTTPVLIARSWDLNVLMDGGDDFASTLGINVRRVRGTVLVLSALVAATIVCLTGIIAFVGLVGPHLARFVLGGDNRYAVPGSALVGAGLVVIADTVGRLLLEPIQLPIGIVVSFVGVPMFLYLLLTRDSAAW